MKKHYLALAAFLLIGLHAAAQTMAPYAFTKTTETYAHLVGGTSVNQGQLWDDPEYTIPIGFTFNWFGQPISSLWIGYGLGATVQDSVDSEYTLMPFEADLIDRGDISGTSVSPISYKVEGVPGNRIFKLEWRNAGFYNEGDELNTLNDYVNVQLWLFESTGVIESHYGESSVLNAAIDYNSESGAIVGMEDFENSRYLYLTGTAANPTPTTAFTYVDGTPSSGTVYRFTPTATGIQTQHMTPNTITAYPNPMNQTANIYVNGLTPSDAQLRVVDAFGRTVKQIDGIHSNKIVFERGDLATGMYFFHLIEKNTTLATGKLMID